MDAHNVQIGPNGEIVCTNCGLREGFQDGCKFSIEKTKIEVENKRIEVENMRIEVEKDKIRLGAVLSSLLSHILLICSRRLPWLGWFENADFTLN